MRSQGTRRSDPASLAVGVTLIGGILLLVAAASLGILSWATSFVLVVGFAITRYLGRKVGDSRDLAWLPALLPVAFLVKMLGGLARYYVAFHSYEASDAASYYRIAVEIAPQLRQLQWPDVNSGSLGTQNVASVTGVLFTLTGMDRLGGFLVFSCISFVGLLFFYLAYRRAASGPSLKLYFLGVFFLPTMFFWPSSIGKEALMTFTLGLAGLGVARILSRQMRGGLALVAVGVASTYMIRPHIATIALGAVAVGYLAALQIRTTDLRAMRYRVVILVVVSAAMFVLVPAALNQIGADEGLVTFAEEMQQRTAIGGSTFEATPILSPTSIPLGVISVVARPFPFEATSAAQLVASLEGLLLLILLARSLPRMVRERGRFLSQPYLSFALAFTLGFIVAFSTVSNLGILARQRAQVLPFLLVIIAAFSPPFRRLGNESPDDSRTAKRRSKQSEVGQDSLTSQGVPGLDPTKAV